MGSESSQIIGTIEKELIRLKVDCIKPSDFEINFLNSFFNGQGRNHLMAPIDKGYFKLTRDLKTLEYSFSVTRMFYITLSMSLFFGLISQNYWVGLIFFLWLFGMSWGITLIRQSLFMNKLKKKLAEKKSCIQ